MSTTIQPPTSAPVKNEGCTTHTVTPKMAPDLRIEVEYLGPCEDIPAPMVAIIGINHAGSNRNLLPFMEAYGFNKEELEEEIQKHFPASAWN